MTDYDALSTGLIPRTFHHKVEGLEKLGILDQPRFLRGEGKGCAKPGVLRFWDLSFKYTCGRPMLQISAVDWKRASPGFQNRREK